MQRTRMKHKSALQKDSEKLKKYHFSEPFFFKKYNFSEKKHRLWFESSSSPVLFTSSGIPTVNQYKDCIYLHISSHSRIVVILIFYFRTTRLLEEFKLNFQ